MRVQLGSRPLARRLLAGLWVAGLLLVGGLAGRATVPDPSGPQPSGGEQAIAVLPAGSLGPARWVAGVPVGWAADPRGAVAAAASYTQTLTTPWFATDPARRHAAVAAMAAPSARASLLDSQDAAAAALLAGPLGPGLRATPERVVLRVGVLGYTLEQAGSHAATVALWTVLVYGDADRGLAPETVWGTTRLWLVWAGGDWKLERVATTAGPVPFPSAQPPTDPAAVSAAATTLLELRYAPSH